VSREELLGVRRLFDGRRLEHARELKGLLKSELAEALGLSPAAIGQFESGASRPNTGTIIQLASALEVMPEFFVAGRPQIDLAETSVHFRSLRSTAKRERTQARAQVRLLAELVEVLSHKVRLPAVNLPSYPLDTDPEAAANDIRRLWGLGDKPVSDVVRLLETHGIVVVRLEAASEDLDAFSCWVTSDRPFVILTSNKDAADRSRFDAAHELYHLLAHKAAVPGDRQLELDAHRFAAALLMPAAPIRSELPRRLAWTQIAELKLRWGVSMAALVHRAHELGMLTDMSYRRAMMDMTRRKWRKTEPISLGDPERPMLLTKAMEIAGYAGLDQIASELAVSPSGLDPFRAALQRSSLPELAL
jgi:Zn-dependent peptidase ImmA (M78 family)/DNA-binding XRE family transcriptional regulator